MRNLNENSLAEQPVIEWLKGMGYDYEFGPDLAPGQILPASRSLGAGWGEREDFREVVLAGRLKRSIRRLNPDLPEAAIDDVVRTITKYEHQNLEIANKEVYRILTHGVKVG